MHVKVADFEFPELPLERRRFDAEVDECADHHVAADARETVEIKDFHETRSKLAPPGREWKLKLPPSRAGGPSRVTATALKRALLPTVRNLGSFAQLHGAIVERLADNGPIKTGHAGKAFDVANARNPAACNQLDLESCEDFLEFAKV